jgi:hypothetical protein
MPTDSRFSSKVRKWQRRGPSEARPFAVFARGRGAKELGTAPGAERANEMVAEGISELRDGYHRKRM